MAIIKNVSIIFTSIFFESLPFLLLGALISSIIETFVSDETMAKIIPKNKVLGSLVGIILGFFLPACDCAVIPVAKRLIKKKVPLNVAISFMLASPIINPVVLLSTYYAFYKTNPNIFWGRLALGIIVALIIGIIMGIIYGKKKVIINDTNEEKCCCHHHHHNEVIFDDIDNEDLEDDECEYCHNKFISIIKHTAMDFYEVSKYLIIGALIASVIQVTLPRTVLTFFNNNNFVSIIVLMIFAYLISLCSTSDSFVGKSLLSSFTNDSIIAYLLLGPMIDVKNTFVLLGNYKKSFVLVLISLIFIAVFICSIVWGIII